MIVKGNVHTILDARATQAMRLVTINIENIKTLTKLETIIAVKSEELNQECEIESKDSLIKSSKTFLKEL